MLTFRNLDTALDFNKVVDSFARKLLLRNSTHFEIRYCHGAEVYFILHAFIGFVVVLLFAVVLFAVFLSFLLHGFILKCVCFLMLTSATGH